MKLATSLTIGEQGKAQVRATVFGHLAGVVLAPTVKALWDRRVFEFFPAIGEWVEFDRIARETRANRGYLRIALRLLASCGWLEQRAEGGQAPRFALTAEGAVALREAPLLYGEILSFVAKAVFLEDFLFGASDRPVLASLQELVRRSKERWGLEGDAESSRRAGAKANSRTSGRPADWPGHGGAGAGGDSGAARAAAGRDQ